MVFGRLDDIERVAKEVIEPLQTASRRHFATIPVAKVRPTDLWNKISPMFQRPEGDESVGMGMQVTPNDNGKTLVVWGTEAEVAKAQQLVQEFDDEIARRAGGAGRSRFPTASGPRTWRRRSSGC